MKKILLTTVALLSMASASVFGMYGVDSDWIDFLTHGNQFRARFEQLGFTLGNDTIKGTFGFDSPDTLGAILQTKYEQDGSGQPVANTPQRADFFPNISAGIGYTSSLIGIGVGYTISIKDQWRGVDGKAHQQAAHTPTLVLNALDNNLRIAIPIQVFHTTKLQDTAYGTPFDASVEGNQSLTTNSITAVSLDAQFRYYTGLEALPQVRLYVRYGMASAQEKSAGTDADGNATTETRKTKFDSFGFDFRLFFGSMVEDVALQPLFRVKFDTALDNYLGNSAITAVRAASGTYNTSLFGFAEAPRYAANRYQLLILGGLGLSANSDVVSLFLRPELGLKVNGTGNKDAKVDFGLGWNVYAEIYITPIKNLEWYFEFNLGNDSPSYVVNDKSLTIYPAVSTGITWYLPQL